MRTYEVMLILPAEADESAVTGAVDRISRVIGETDGTVTNVDTWGRRRLAHQIDKRTEGSYVVVDMSADPTVIVELERVLRLADDVVRFKVVTKPPERKRRFPRKAAGSPASESSAASNGSAAQAATPPEDAEGADATAAQAAVTEPEAAQAEATEPEATQPDAPEPAAAAASEPEPASEGTEELGATASDADAQPDEQAPADS
jgi:small subunit ribosomal protein S6